LVGEKRSVFIVFGGGETLTPIIKIGSSVDDVGPFLFEQLAQLLSDIECCAVFDLPKIAALSLIYDRSLKTENAVSGIDYDSFVGER
jgi:hypothetical protein